MCEGTSAADEFNLATSLPVLREAYAASVAGAYEIGIPCSGRETVKEARARTIQRVQLEVGTALQSFQMCKAKQGDLSTEMLTSLEPDRALGVCLAQDAILRDGIARHHQTVDALNTIADDLTETDETAHGVFNHSNIAVTVAIETIAEIDWNADQAVTVEVPGAQTVRTATSRTQLNPHSRGLAASGAYEGMRALENRDERLGEDRIPRVRGRQQG